MKDYITIKGARENNLKDITLSIPRNKLIVFTGLSGSGKSSLAFETIFAEGQRRYVESLSSYARQFLGQMDKPDVDYIEGLSPAVSIDQKSTSNNPRSTVGTVTEINDYLRLLFARIGVPHCPKCGRVITRQSIDQVVDQILRMPAGTKFQIVAPVIRGIKGEHVKLLERIRKDGYVRVKIDGETYDISELPALDKNKKHNIDVIVDRLVIKDGIQMRLTDSLETAFALGSGLAKADIIGGEEQLFSQNYACPDCGINIEELTPRMFSFNNPYGACPACTGLGFQEKIDVSLVVGEPDKSLLDGAVSVMGWGSGNPTSDNSMRLMYYKALAKEYDFDISTPWNELPESVRDVILYGSKGKKILIEYSRDFGSGSFLAPFEGIIPSIERRYNETQSEAMS